MTTLAIVGAGTGLGAAVARRFGAEGFDVAVISRRQDRVDALAADLAAAGFTARGYAASVRDLEALTGALDQAANDLGPIEVLQYSPVPQAEFMQAVLDTTVADLTGAVEFSIYGPLTAVRHVLPGMRTLGRGTVLFVNGGSGARPNPKVAGTSIAFAGEGAYAAMLHTAVAEENIPVGQLIIPGGITPGPQTHDPDVLADRLWAMHTSRDTFRVFAEPMNGMSPRCARYCARCRRKASTIGSWASPHSMNRGCGTSSAVQLSQRRRSLPKPAAGLWPLPDSIPIRQRPIAP